jgi:hypothetical protein
MMSSEGNNRVFVNGAWIDKVFLEENISEARGTSWVKVVVDPLEEHHHCIVCNFAIGPQNSSFAYKSPIGWLDSYCFEHFINQE